MSLHQIYTNPPSKLLWACQRAHPPPLHQHSLNPLVTAEPVCAPAASDMGEGLVPQQEGRPCGVPLAAGAGPLQCMVSEETHCMALYRQCLPPPPSGRQRLTHSGPYWYISGRSTLVTMSPTDSCQGNSGSTLPTLTPAPPPRGRCSEHKRICCCTKRTSRPSQCTSTHVMRTFNTFCELYGLRSAASNKWQ